MRTGGYSGAVENVTQSQLGARIEMERKENWLNE